MRRVQLITAALAVAALAGCSDKTLPGGTGSPESPFKIGQTDFVSQAPGGGARGGGPLASAGEGDNAGAGTTGGTGTGGSGATEDRTIEEADIYKVVGNTLYVLNAYRGLQIIDVSDLSHPHLLAKVSVVGTPKDLYIEGNTAYVVVSDAFYYGYPIMFGGIADSAGAAGTVTTSPWIGSQVWAIDVTQPASPVVRSTLPIDGTVDETRIVGDVLYVVSNVYSWYYWGPNASSTSQNLTFVQSFDISNPTAMHSVARRNFPADGWNIHANVTQSRIVLAESGYDYDSNGYGGPITQFIPIDISDPDGALALGTTFQTAGTVADRWAMDFDASTQLFRAVVQNDWGNTGGSLFIWSAPTISSATQVGSLALNLQERVTAASFDGPRAYIVTSYCTDPLWIIDTSDPAHPQVKGSVHMSGALDFILPRGNQLLALGHDSSGCMAWEGSGQLAVSLFDVTDAAHPVMTSRVDFGSDYSYINAEADDMKKAFQVLDSMGLILVPFQSWDSTNWTQVGGTQLIDLGQNALTLRGFAEHAGNIERAFPVQDKLVALSDRGLQVLDASDRDHPTTLATLDLARPVIGMAFVGDKAIELSGDWSLGDTELAVTNASTPDQAEPLAKVALPSPNSRMFQDGNIIWVLANDYQHNTAWVQAIDVSNPVAPQVRGQLALDPATVGNNYGSWSWGYGAEAQLVNHALVLHNVYYGCYEYCGSGSQGPSDSLQVIDLRNPDQPVLEAPITLSNSDWSWGLNVVGNYAWITHYEWLGTSGVNPQSWVRYYVDRLDLTDPGAPHLLHKVNVPGVFFAASEDGQTLYTQDTTYDTTGNSWTPTTWLNKLQLLPGGIAQLQASSSLAGYPEGASADGDYAYVLSSTWDPTTYVSSSTLHTFRLQDLAATNTQSLGANWAYLQKAAGGKVFIRANWYDSGLLIYDLADPSAPQFQGSVRTQGWIQDILVRGNTAYLPSGQYGVPMLDLTPGSPLPPQL